MEEINFLEEAIKGYKNAETEDDFWTMRDHATLAVAQQLQRLVHAVENLTYLNR